MEAESSRLPCLTVETMAAFVGGGLPPAEIAGVEAHLAGCDECRAVVADAAFGAMRTTTGDGAAAAGMPPGGQGLGDDSATVLDLRARTPRVLSAGDVVGEKYVVEDWLGGGGMGDVFAARHLNLGHRVAIKVLRYAGPTAAVRFFREARICARLSSEHVSRVFDVGRLPDGAPFLVMEMLVGKDLSRVLAEGPLAIEAAVDYALQICAGLGEAHRAGIVHRDIKPANIFLVTARAGAGEPLIKVLDFGISKVAADDGTSSLGLTATGAVMGSPLYMSPEQVRASQDVDGRTDIWSLGAIIYELVTGQPPFRRPTLSALALAIATDQPPPPSTLRPGLPAGLETVILRCLAKDRDARFPTLEAVTEALAPFASGAVVAAPVPPAIAASQGVRARPVPMSGWKWTRARGATVAALAAVASLAVALIATQRPPASRPAPTPASAAAVTATSTPVAATSTPLSPPPAAPPPAAPPLEEPTPPAPAALAPVRPAAKKSKPRRSDVAAAAPRPPSHAPAQPAAPASAVDPLATPD